MSGVKKDYCLLHITHLIVVERLYFKFYAKINFASNLLILVIFEINPIYC